MRVTILQGSARKKRNTAKVLGWVEKELTSMEYAMVEAMTRVSDSK